MTFEEKVEASAKAERRRQHHEGRTVRQKLRDDMRDAINRTNPAIPLRFTEVFLDEAEMKNVN